MYCLFARGSIHLDLLPLLHTNNNLIPSLVYYNPVKVEIIQTVILPPYEYKDISHVRSLVFFSIGNDYHLLKPQFPLNLRSIDERRDNAKSEKYFNNFRRKVRKTKNSIFISFLVVVAVAVRT